MYGADSDLAPALKRPSTLMISVSYSSRGLTHGGTALAAYTVASCTRAMLMLGLKYEIQVWSSPTSAMLVAGAAAGFEAAAPCESRFWASSALGLGL